MRAGDVSATLSAYSRTTALDRSSTWSATASALTSTSRRSSPAFDDRVLETGMVFALEPCMYDVTGIGILCLEELLATKDGEPVRLSELARDERR